jgi:hypothetical protein
VRKGTTIPTWDSQSTAIDDAPGYFICAQQEGVARIVQDWRAEVERMLREVILNT